MCGLAGYIGNSKNKDLTFKIISKLLSKSEIRGIDAAGYWGVDEEKNVLYHKEPGRASLLIEKDAWELLSKYNLDILLTHARGASKGVGEPKINSNNHPFVNDDKSIGLIHNGRIDDCEYSTLKQNYNLKSNCDSEILLRIFESEEDKLISVKNIFGYINQGHMAVAIGERLDDRNVLWLFRNKYRPLWLVDLRHSLGQIFFISDPLIWKSAIDECEDKNFFKNQKIVELPTEEIWKFDNFKQELILKKYRVIKKNPIPFVVNDKISNIKNKKSNFKTITILEDNDELPVFEPLKPNKEQQNQESEQELEYIEIDEDVDFPLIDFNYKCNEIIGEIEAIRTGIESLVLEKSITNSDFMQLLKELENQKEELNSLMAYYRC